jgi:HEAT repeat protein
VAAEYPDEDALAGFLGIFQGITTSVAFLASLLAANRLYARFGFMGAILALALIYLLGFGALVMVTSFAALLAFRFFQMVWAQGMASTAYQATFNIVPVARREQTRTFISGVPEQLGVVLVGLLLAAGEQTLQARHMFFIGIGMAVLTTLVMWQARRAYGGALVEALRSGQSLVFSSEEEPFGGFRRDAPAVEAAVAGLTDRDPAVRRVSAEILGNLAVPEVVDSLVALLEDEDSAVRAATLRALTKAQASETILEVVARLKDSEVDVRLQAVSALKELARFPQGLRNHITPLLEDPDVAVRARTAATLVSLGPDEAAEAVLVEMARLPESTGRILALETLAETDSPKTFDLASEALQDPHPSVRYAAAHAIRQADPEQCLTPLVQALADEDNHVRAGVAEAIGHIGSQALEPILAALAEPHLEEGALSALEYLPATSAAESLRVYASSRIELALRYHTLWHGIRTNTSNALHNGQESLELLLASLRDKSLRQGHFALRAIGVLGDRGAIALARENLASPNPNQRANALETLDSVAERDFIRPLLRIWESEAGEAPLDDDWLLQLLEDADSWLRACALLVASNSGDTQIQARLTTMAEDDPDDFIRDTLRQISQADDPVLIKGGQAMDTLPTMSVMERILYLRRVSLFADLPPAELKQLASIAGEHFFVDGDVIAHRGEPGDEMYIIVSGEVRVLGDSDEGPVELALRQPGDGVGEMGVISQEPRMASLVAKGDVRILYIEQKRFESILRERPDISLAVMRVLISRLKETQTQANASF